MICNCNLQCLVGKCSLRFAVKTRANKVTQQYASNPLRFTRTLRVTTHNLDSVRVYRVRIVQLEVDVFDDEGPYFVAEAVSVEMSLRQLSAPVYGSEDFVQHTLNVKRALTLSARTSATALSKLVSIFIASCGSIRRSVISWSRVSVRALPNLCTDQYMRCDIGQALCVRATPVQLIILGVCHFDPRCYWNICSSTGCGY